MAGSDHVTQAEAFIAKLTGATVTAGDRLRLSSAQKAAIRAWARNTGAPLDLQRLNQGVVTITGLLGEDGGLTSTQPPARAPDRAKFQMAGGIGIDIEDLSTLPDAEDFRAHPFYRENFTDSEIAYCILQSSPKLSFCGLWAAKEALIKAGAEVGQEGLRVLEIDHESGGRPGHPGFSLSISHTATTAAAVALAAPPPAIAPDAEMVEPSVPETRRGYSAQVLALVVSVVAFGLGYLTRYLF